MINYIAMFRFRNKIILLLVVIGVMIAAGFVFAQPDLGLNEFGAQTNLGTKPLGQTIAEIVRVFLSVLGIIAVILTLYAGFLWMTAAGNAEKIATAKKILINAVIGLAIILSSLAITQFIIGALGAATGTNIGAIGGGGPGGGGGLPSDAFVVKGISPQGSVPIRNVVARVALNHSPDATTIAGNVLVTKKSDSSIAGITFAVNNDTIELTPSAGCPAPNASIKCLEANTAYKVEVKIGLKDTGGKNLNCGGFAPNCIAEFTTGTLIDTAAPLVAVTYPDPGQSVSESSMVAVWAKATDDAAISGVDFFADSAYFDKAIPAGASPSVFEGKVFWNTAGVARGNHNLSAKAYDADSNNAISAPLTVSVRAAHCFNGIKDADETGVDSGGADCALGAGASCAQNSDCASVSCVAGVCVDTPVILGVSPQDGAPGTYITIFGKYFGSVPGTATFLGGAGPADDKVAALGSCNGAWGDTQVVAVVPQGAASGPIEIKNSVGSDTTNDPRGPVLPNYVITSTLRPGICSLTPSEGKSGTSFTIAGAEFGASQGTSFIKFGNTYAAPQTWANASIAALVPVLSAGGNSVQVNRDGVDSNALNFKVLSPVAGTKPTINYVDPGTGPAGEYITVFGSNFGEASGVVQFLRADGTAALGDINFSQACAAVNYWHNGYITIKVPDKFSDGASTKNTATSLRVRRADSALSNTVSFSITSDTPKPGLCGLKPDNGPIGTAVNVLGERFGAGGAVTFYNNVGAAPVAWGSEMIQTAAPKGAVSGPVKITVASKDSNSVNFSVSDCSKTPGICTVDQQCCGASCISKTEVCQAAPKEGAYAWRISTGIIPRAPRVVEDCSIGAAAANPSPSPWDARPGGNSVCVNAVANVRFDSKLEPATVIMTGSAADTIALYKCAGASSTPCSSKIKVALDALYSKIYSINNTEDGIQLYPSGGKLEKNTQYRVELAAGIKGAGAGGGFMEEQTDCGAGLSYCFNFKTINSDGLCKVGSLVTSPQNYISDKKELLEYISSPRAKDDVCLNINAAAYSYTWGSSQLSAAISKIGFNLKNQPVSNAALIQTIFETSPNLPAIITSAIPQENVSGKTNLTIKFADPAVVEKWPSCVTACVNSTIGAKFNVDMDSATIVPANITVFSCATENCDSFSGTIGGTISYDAAGKKFNFIPAQNLAVNTFYLVRLKALNIKSVSGVALTGGASDGFYAWQFRTRADATPCAVNKVTINPASQIFNFIPQLAEFNSEALGAPDVCNPQGQKLNPYSYGWSWASDAPGAVLLKNNGAYNVLPPAGAGCSDRCLRTGSIPNASVCGNGKTEKGESCDDGNATAKDLCSDRCLNEGTSAPACGNSVKNFGEDCDLGAQNGKAGSGCSANCLSLGSAAGGSTCGNGPLPQAVGKGENCDDGNTASGDGCSSQCLNEGSTPNIASCGNNIAEKNLGEDCDLGAQNGKADSGCSSVCLNTGMLAPVCGNGAIDNGEDCDDGNLDGGDGCSPICLNEGSNLKYGSVCGNGGAPEKGESCDAGVKDANIDPRQYGEARGQGKTKISASTQNVTGAADAEVLCVYTTDAQCQSFGSDLGVGKDNCCYVRPQAVLTIPKPGETGICRNTLISATFDQLIDGASGELSIDQKKNGASCPAGSVTSSDGAWCLGAIKATREIFDNNNQTQFDWSISDVLAAGKTYRAVLKDFKNKSGVLQLINPYSWTFTAGNDVCKVDKVKVAPDPIIFYHTKPDGGNNPRQAKADAVSFKNGNENPIASIPGIYAWDWKWSTQISPKSLSLGDSKLNPVTITALPENGEGMLVATASSTADKFKLSAGAGKVSGAAKVTVFLCENPWPGVLTFPWQIDTSANASTYYCRDNKLNPLPDLKITPISGSGDLLKEYLLTNPQTGDAVGIRIYKNEKHLSPLAWYKSKQFVGSPAAAQVDGYEAVADGRTTYVNAANHLDSTSANYTNIFVIAYSQTASQDMQNIYNQILKNWKFNTNLEKQNILQCFSDGKSCSSDLDCAKGDCQSPKDKIRRDAKRLSDFNDIADSLESYKQKNNTYPPLLSGSFLRGMSVSVWPSWQAALGNDLGRALPVDPINKHAACPKDYDTATCWNGAAGQYICPSGSRVYNYRNVTQDAYQFSSDLEYNSGAGWSGISSNFSTAGSCAAATIGTSAKCGDGIVGANEECEKGMAKAESCLLPDGRTGARPLTCIAASCTWDRSAACAIGKCGDGIAESGEACDDGQNNGKYGYCRTDCSGLGQYCGDNIINGSEQCDLGKKGNGQYKADINLSCSWDCKKPGISCGDKIIQSQEQCDGNSETKKTDASGAACADITVNGVSYPTQSSRTCDESACVWNNWVDCQPAGSCGNGVKEGTEPCDTGVSAGTSGSCVMDKNNNYSCKTAVCGDGYLRAGYEACDSGASNGSPCTAAYGLTCNYCSISCNTATVTGGYCGDGIKNGLEECEGNNFGGLFCSDFAFSGGNLKCSSCKIDISGCQTSSLQTITLPPPPASSPPPPPPACANQCVKDARACNGSSGYVICKDYNGDGCTEWGQEISCRSGEICSGATCVTQTQFINPFISSISPNQGAVDSIFTISGNNFSEFDDVRVQFYAPGTPAGGQVLGLVYIRPASSNLINGIVVPKLEAGTYNIRIEQGLQNNLSYSNPYSFTVTIR